MKHYLLFLLCGFSLITSAQNKIIFNYDIAGNQVKRELVCISCRTSEGQVVKDAKTLIKEDLIKSEVSDQISYYPNPVKQELYLSWELVNNTAVSSIQLYSVSGQLLQSFTKTNKINVQTIPFVTYPRGVYMVVLFYSNGEQKSIKIIKQ
ncbi:T9SS type A sorting domain-containing protein [Flavobacterium sp. W1B]|uniref:T9SS type A sorting domain-containing protein n=1 Tax=Flavobacterium sp. W1B TaxID=3394146 RepID=UPI0039BD0D37